ELCKSSYYLAFSLVLANLKRSNHCADSYLSSSLRDFFKISEFIMAMPKPAYIRPTPRAKNPQLMLLRGAVRSSARQSFTSNVCTSARFCGRDSFPKTLTERSHYSPLKLL